MTLEPSLAVVQNMAEKPAYHLSELSRLAGSRATAYRILAKLKEAGFAESLNRGYFSLRSSIFQPYRIWQHILPSLEAFTRARYFGRAYDESDVSYARRSLTGFLTLDYRAYELTKFQTPRTCYLYVDKIDEVARRLIHDGFSQGRAGRVAVMPRIGTFQREIQRVYLDCLAAGGRSVLDAIAIELRYADSLSIRGEFPVSLVSKVEEDLPPRT